MPRKIPVTVLIPAYNAQDFLKAAIDTVRAQSVSVEEIIVVDDESSDNTATIAEKLGVRVLRELRGGPAAARNAGLAVATSEWIATLDADDIWHPRKLEFQYDAILAEPKLGLIFTDFDAVAMSDGSVQRSNVVANHRAFKRLKRTALTPQANILDFNEFLVELPARNIVLPSTAMFRRQLAIEIGGFPLNVKAEDAEFFLRLVSRTATGFIDLPLVAYLRHRTQITANWELDPVRLALYHHVISNKDRYHELIVAGFRAEYANLLYYSAANAATKRKLGTSAALLAKAIAVAVTRGQLPSLSRSVGQSRALRSRLRPATTTTTAGNGGSALESVIREIEIPWRQKQPA